MNNLKTVHLYFFELKTMKTKQIFFWLVFHSYEIKLDWKRIVNATELAPDSCF